VEVLCSRARQGKYRSHKACGKRICENRESGRQCRQQLGFCNSDRSVLVFDTHFTPEAGQALLAAIRSVTIKAGAISLSNSHAHADHTHGNQAFGDAQLISSSSRQARCAAKRSPISEPDLSDRSISNKQNAARSGAGSRCGSDTANARADQIREDYLKTISYLKIMAPFVM